MRPESGVVAVVRRLLADAKSLAAGVMVEERGMAAVEFAIILPILVVLWIGGVEVTGALSVDRRLNNFASSIGDLVARSKKIDYADVDAIFGIAPGAMYPSCRSPHTLAQCVTAGLNMRITEVKIDADGNATVYWSRATGSTLTAHAVDAPMDSFVPESLRVPSTHVVMSEVSYTYSPAVGYVLTGDLDLEDRMFFVPRLSNKVRLCADKDDDATCTT